MSEEKFNPNPEEYKLPEYPDKNDPEEKKRIDDARQIGRNSADALFGPYPINVLPRKGSSPLSNLRESSWDDEELRRTARRIAYMKSRAEETPPEVSLHEIFGQKDKKPELTPREKYSSSVENNISIEEFTAELSDLFENDPWLRGQVGDWDLLNAKSKDLNAPKFKLSIVFENNRHKHKKEKTVITGTHKDIMEALDEELVFHEPHLHVVGDE